ncbi:MAG: TIGR03619 family F420-dependent LLM class oxidoreductase [Acidimicrobiales bacterium]|nr:TIGR03619 family F420-dependent LLM class oxidoreductase [Acidimicrobiales bacterium]
MASITPEGGALYGIQLPIQTLTKTLADPWEDDATPGDLLRVAQAAEAAGLDFIGVCDHVAIPDDEYAKGMRTTWYDPVATLAWLGARTTSIRLLSVVLVAAYRHPLLTAKSFGTLAHLTGDRVILGVGAGHVKGEFTALDVDYSRRGKILDECIDAVRGAFVDTYVSHEGINYSYQDVGISPGPASGHLPIWIGGSGVAAWKRTGRRGDGYIPMGASRDLYPQIIDTIRRSADEAHRPNDRFDVGIMPGWTYIGDPPEHLPPAWLTGSPDHIAAELRADRETGANVFHLKFRGRTIEEYLDQLAAFGEDVRPLL